MKRLLCCLVCCCGLFAATVTASAQMSSTPAKLRPAPASPPALAVGTIDGRSVWIAYSSPGVKGREGKIFGPDGLVKTAGGSQYPIWRTGANSATTLIVSGKVKIGDLVVPPGAYTLFADITDQNNWTLIVNKKTGEWGLAYDPASDLGKTKFTMSAPPSMVENLKWEIADKGDGTGTLTLTWENHSASVTVDAR
jgi:hypothetical protein